jgi:hypothetical protein
MFTSFPDQIAAGVRPLFISQLTLWSAINQRALDGVVALAALNMNTARQSVTDVSEVFRSVGADRTGEEPLWSMVGQLPQGFGSFGLYGREASNICMAMQSDIVKFMQQGLNEVAHDMPSMFKDGNIKDANIDSPPPRVSRRKKS